MVVSIAVLTVLLVLNGTVERTPGTPQQEEIKWNEGLPKDRPNDRTHDSMTSNTAHVTAVLKEAGMTNRTNVWNEAKDRIRRRCSTVNYKASDNGACQQGTANKIRNTWDIHTI